MLIVIILIGAFFINYVLQKAYSHLWNRNLDVVAAFQKEPTIEGREAYLTETITNRKWLFLPVLQVGFHIHRNLWFADGENTSVSDQCYKRDIFSVGPYQKITRTIPFRCTKRGYYEIDKIELVTHSPLMTKKSYMTLMRPDYFYVYPRRVDERKLEVPFQKIMGEVLTQKNLYEDPFEFRGIREYQPTDSMHKINWKASARSDQWMVNLYSSTSAQEVVILLDVEDETIWKYDAIHEEGIRLAVSLAAHCMEKGIPVSLRTNARDLLTKEVFSLDAGVGKRQLDAINEGLARIDLAQKPDRMEFVLQREREAMQGNTATYLMISKSQRESCLEAYEKLLQNGTSGIWIATLHQDMEWEPAHPVTFPVLRWEVEK